MRPIPASELRHALSFDVKQITRSALRDMQVVAAETRARGRSAVVHHLMRRVAGWEVMAPDGTGMREVDRAERQTVVEGVVDGLAPMTITDLRSGHQDTSLRAVRLVTLRLEEAMAEWTILVQEVAGNIFADRVRAAGPTPGPMPTPAIVEADLPY